jgi:hypothetical protein
MKIPSSVESRNVYFTVSYTSLTWDISAPVLASDASPVTVPPFGALAKTTVTLSGILEIDHAGTVPDEVQLAAYNSDAQLGYSPNRIAVTNLFKNNPVDYNTGKFTWSVTVPVVGPQTIYFEVRYWIHGPSGYGSDLMWAPNSYVVTAGDISGGIPITDINLGTIDYGNSLNTWAWSGTGTVVSGSDTYDVTSISVVFGDNTYSLSETVTKVNGSPTPLNIKTRGSYTYTGNTASMIQEEYSSNGGITWFPSLQPAMTVTVLGDNLSFPVPVTSIVLTKPGVSDAAVAAGMWTAPNDGEGPPVISFNPFNNSVVMPYGDVLGTYSLTGTALTLTLTYFGYNQQLNGTASVSGDTLTISGFSGAITGYPSLDASIFNAAYPRAGELRLNPGHPAITGYDPDSFTVWIRDASGGAEWSGNTLNISTFGTWVPGGSGYYNPDATIVAATPGQPSQYGYGDLAPLRWITGSRTGSYDIFITTIEGPPNSFTGRYKNNVSFTNGVADITIDGSWTGWTFATIGAGGS